MSVQFEDDNFSHIARRSGTPQKPKTGSAIGNWLIRMGLATDEASANTVMISGAVAIFAFSIYIFIFGFNLPFGNEVPQYTDIPLPPELVN